MRVAVAHSDDPDAGLSTEDVVSQIEAQLDGMPPAGALLYTCIDIDHQRILDDLQARWPGLPLVGCTTDGECSSVLDFTEDSVVLTVIAGDEVDVRTGIGTGLRQDAAAAARGAMAQVCADGPPGLVVALPESIGVSGASVVHCLNRHLPEGAVLVGGTAGDQWRFERPLQFFGDRILTGALPLMAFGPGLTLSTGVASGWKPMGPRGTVTRAEGSTVYEFDGKPAIEFFYGYLGIHAEANPEYPFAIYEGDTEDYYLRAPFGFDETTGHIVFAGDIPVGAEVRITEAGRDQILHGASIAVADAVAAYPGDTPQALLVFSCAARKQVLGTRCAEEIGLLRGALERPLDAAGFYTYGEIAPLAPGSEARFHNETVVATLIGG